MPDKTIMDLPDIGETPNDGDYLEIVDTSDNTDDPDGSSKRVSVVDLLAGVASAPASGRVLIEEIELTVAGEFDFENIPQTYSSLYLNIAARGDKVVSNAGWIKVVINDVTSVANYDCELSASFNSGAVNTSLPYPGLGSLPGTLAPTGEHGFCSSQIMFYRKSGLRKKILSEFAEERATGQSYVGQTVCHSNVTGAITRLRIQADNHPTNGLTGVARLYGEP